MRELGPGVPVAPETLRPAPVGGDGDQEVGQPPPALTAHRGVHGQVPPVGQRGLVVGVETDKVVQVFESRSQTVELVSKLVIRSQTVIRREF